MDFSDSLAVYDKVDLCNQLNDFFKKKSNGHKMSISFTDLCPGCFRFSTFNFFQTASPLNPLGRLKLTYMWSLNVVGEQNSRCLN